MSRKGLPWLRPSRPARSSPTKVTIAMPWSTSSRHPVPRRSSHLEAIAIPNAKSTGTATRHETSSSDSSIASSSSGVSQLDTTNLPVASTPSCISPVPISGYCERALGRNLANRCLPKVSRLLKISADMKIYIPQSSCFAQFMGNIEPFLPISSAGSVAAQLISTTC